MTRQWSVLVTVSAIIFRVTICFRIVDISFISRVIVTWDDSRNYTVVLIVYLIQINWSRPSTRKAIGFNSWHSRSGNHGFDSQRSCRRGWDLNRTVSSHFDRKIRLPIKSFNYRTAEGKSRGCLLQLLKRWRNIHAKHHNGRWELGLLLRYWNKSSVITEVWQKIFTSKETKTVSTQYQGDTHYFFIYFSRIVQPRVF